MEYVVDTHELRVRLARDGRTLGLIARDAKLPVEIFKNVLATGKAEKEIVDKIRLSVRPRMRFYTICPVTLQPKNDLPKTHKQLSTTSLAELARAKFPEETKKACEIFDKIYELCREYTIVDVYEAIFDLQMNILCYLQDSGFDLVDLYDETIKDLPGVKEA